jgi:hypothetical protein
MFEASRNELFTEAVALFATANALPERPEEMLL